MEQTSLLAPAAAAPRLLRWDPASWPVAPDWRPTVAAFFASPEGQRLGAFIEQRIAQGAVIYPPAPLCALELTPLACVRALILGQDPYHGPGQAEGLAFSVPDGVKPPPSLRNIHKELGQAGASGSLAGWARRGVLLLNASLTVEQGQAGSHAGRGWEVLTDALVRRVAQTATPCVYLLWGVPAQSRAPLIRETAAAHGRETLILEANHPSPLSARRPPRPFLGCGHFALARQWLSERGCGDVFAPG